MRFLLTGGIARPNAAALGEGKRYEAARLVRLNWSDKSLEPLITVDEANDCYPDITPNLLFTSATLLADELYLCSETEVFVYRYPGMHLLRKASYPCFQNVHHVTRIGDDVVVASTGLDLIVVLDAKTLAIKGYHDPLGRPLWQRFSPTVDYRKIHSTKPHDSHPNFIFDIDGRLWVTRFVQKDAVCLDDLTQTLKIGTERVHDGHVVGEHIYFTTVDGHVVVFHKQTLSQTADIDLNTMDSRGGPLGWCRGLHVEGDRLFVGFSALRKTRIKENLRWLKTYIGHQPAPVTRIVEYDIKEQRKVDEIALPRGELDVVYSVLGHA